VTDHREPELPFDPSEDASGEAPSPAADESAGEPAAEPVAGPKDQLGLEEGPEADPEADPVPDDDDRMGLLDHLGELRGVLIQSSLAALAATILCWFWSADLLDILILPIKEQGIYFTAPNEAFLTRLKLSAVVGLFVVAPFIFFKIYAFVLPGLYKKERRIVTPLLLATTALFYTGVAFAFLVVIPQVIAFLLGFGTEVMEPLIGVGPYFNFVSHLCLAFGLVFELPLLVFFLSVLGIINPRTLLRAWRYAIIIIVALSAVLTPPDVISQVMMAGPVLVLYVGSVLISIAVTSRRRKDEDEDEDLD
jgi:sec-independent protein translocase protein TatC